MTTVLVGDDNGVGAENDKGICKVAFNSADVRALSFDSDASRM